jgi:hypothetical protein
MVAFKATDSFTNELGPGEDVRVTDVVAAPTDWGYEAEQEEGEAQAEKFASPPI